MQHPEDIATTVVLRFLGTLGRGKLHVVPDESLRQLRNSIRDVIDRVVRHEREACAKIAEVRPGGAAIAEAIRCRREGNPARKWRIEDSPVLS